MFLGDLHAVGDLLSGRAAGAVDLGWVLAGVLTPRRADRYLNESIDRSIMRIRGGRARVVSWSMKAAWVGSRKARPVQSARGSVPIACAAQLSNAVNIGALPLMLPAIAGSMGGAAGGLSWLVAGYAIAFGGLVLWGGKSSDAHGVRRVLAAGFLISAAGALSAALAWSPYVLVAARVVQGVGSALAVPSAMAWLTASTPDPATRSRRLSWFAAFGAIGFAAGALAGGLLSEWLGWRSVFLAQFVVTAVLGVLALRVAPTRLPEKRSIAWNTFATSAALALLVLSLYVGLQVGWAHAATVGAFIATGCAAVVAVLCERFSSNPMVPRRIWKVRGVPGVLTSTALLYAAWTGCYWYGALALQEGVGLGMSAAALWLALLIVGALTGSRSAALVLGRREAGRGLIVVGGGLTVLGAVAASFIPPAPGSTVAYVAALVVAVAGQAMAFVAQSDRLVTLLGSELAGISGGLFNAAGQIGGGVGLAVLAIVAHGTSAQQSEPGQYVEVFGSAALMAAAAIPLVLVGKRQSGPRVSPSSEPITVVRGD